MSFARWRGRRLLLRVYLHGILLLSLAAAASFLVGSYLLKPAVEGPTRPSTAWIAWHLDSLRDQPAVLARELSDLQQRVHIDMSFFERDGRLLASNAATPPAPLSPEELRRLEQRATEFVDGVGVVALRGPSGSVERYARIKYPAPASPFGTAAAQLAAALVVIALMSMPLARSISAPVEGLAQLTRRFGSGDLSARARSERGDEIGDLARAFDEMAERVVALRRSEKELLANVSHELRTPLARMRLALELARDGDTHRARSYLEDIEEDLGELEPLLDDIMTAARLDLARGVGSDALPPLRRQSVPGGELLEAACARFSKRFPERHLDAQLGPGLPLLLADPSLLRRVLDNLLDNAAKFSDPSDGIELTAEARSEPPSLEIRVRDHGIGIAPEDLERVFEPFFRTDRSRSRATGGVGLGLTVVRRIVLAHGGSVRVESNKSSGTCFHISVPANPASAPTAPPPSTQSADAASTPAAAGPGGSAQSAA
ncbi:MAG TPA: HAMP domain-containing sensor histidine kinase [Polyangiaceae bacterium]|nr:HAMP domain-containing sensor histidine kinase [Polyangiaceae bacterium]